MAIKRFLEFSTRASRDVTTGADVDDTEGVDTLNRPLRFGQRAWATFTAWTSSSTAALPSASAETSANAIANATVTSEARDSHDGARHLEIGGYFQADHAWAGASQETAPLESLFEQGSERIFDRYGPH